MRFTNNEKQILLDLVNADIRSREEVIKKHSLFQLKIDTLKIIRRKLLK